MEKEIKIRTFRQEDISSLYELLKLSAPFIQPYPDYIYWFMREYHGNCNLIAVEDEKVVGWLGTLPGSGEMNEVFVFQICVHPSCRGRQIGTRLLETLKSCLEPGKKIIECSISPENPASLQLFRSFAAANGAELVQTDRAYEGAIFENVYRIEIAEEQEHGQTGRK